MITNMYLVTPTHNQCLEREDNKYSIFIELQIFKNLLHEIPNKCKSFSFTPCIKICFLNS
jgi:hypothetical protein